jgi:saxitoxin biosynthesis operon SxtJ-like protein
LIETAPPARKQLVIFGITMAVAFAVIALLRLWRRGADEIAIAVFVVAAIFAVLTLAPSALAPIYRAWMKFAEALGWVNTRVLLILIFYLVVTPIGLIMRLFGRSPLPRDSHWTEAPRNSYGDRHYEKQF